MFSMAKKISDEAVKKRTGKNWKEWFSVLNKAGAKKMEHKEIALLLSEKYHVSDWWSQMVTVQYEQDIKGRKKHETSTGFQISKSKTFLFSVSKIFSAVQSASQRKLWLMNNDFKITSLTKNKSIRAKWVDGFTNIEIQLYAKEKFKTQLVVQHNKLTSEKEADKMKIYWEKKLYNLNNYLNEK
ncbi:MAG: hypothetical protein DAHOPDDO_03352 [Ignavibacteriaceae bacterium]|jgi:hypothetical protein|nr:hypothetical protein [Ignavibacteriaceae bacterium]